MRTIYKYELKIEDEQIIEMPVGATALSVQTQKGRPCLWMIIDNSQPVHQRRFYLIGTGQPCQHCDGSLYVGTFQFESSSLVFHLFDFGYQDTPTRWPV